MGCWKWFSNILKEAKVEVADKNKERIDEVIHRFIGEQSNYSRCSSDWRKAWKVIEADEQMRRELVEGLRSVDDGILGLLYSFLPFF